MPTVGGTLPQEQRRTPSPARTMWALALVSFLAVYREAFETVLFYQALWMQAAQRMSLPLYSGLLAGCCCNARRARVAALTRLVSISSRPFFGAPSALLVLLAVIFAGKGIAALQEAGTLPVEPVNFPGIPALGCLSLSSRPAATGSADSAHCWCFIYTYSSVKET